MKNFLKRNKVKTLYLTLTIIAVISLSVIFDTKQGKGSVPITTGTENFTVDVCINQDCDYVADGQNDEREIQQAIDAVLALGGGKVNIRNGDYNIASPVQVSLSGESLIIEGDGIDTKLTNTMTDASKLGSMFLVDGQAASLLTTPAGSAVSASITGSLDADTYYFRLTTFDDTGAKSQASSEISCTTINGGACHVTWTDQLGSEQTKVWVSTISGSYSEYFIATTTGAYSLATSTNGLIIPQDNAVATSTATAGSLLSGTYHIRISALDASGNETLATDEIGCNVGTGAAEAYATSTQCNITWTDSANATSHRVYVSSFSGNYTGYFLATTTNQYTLATTTSIVSGTLPTSNTTSLITDPVSGTLETISLDSFTMKNLYLVGNSTGGRGIITENINRTSILSNKFTDFTSSATWGIGVYASSSGQTIIRNSVFKDNTEDIELAGKTSNTYIENNRFNDSGEITIGLGTTGINIADNSNLITITDNGGTNVSIDNIGNFAATILGSNSILGTFIDAPSDGSAAITTTGTLTSDIYFLKITATDGAGGESTPSEEFVVDSGVGATANINISWTNVAGAQEYRIWIATTTDLYYEYLVATTTEFASIATTTNLTAGTLAGATPATAAYKTKLATSSPNWINSGNLGLGTSTPQNILSVDSGPTSTTTVEIGDIYSGTGKTCFNIAQADGSVGSFYFTGDAIVVEANACN